ncbi:OmpG family monomeric porin [Salmonella enterica subsp. diarizonae serovar 11:k:z53]
MKAKLLVTSGTAVCLGIIATLLPVCVHAAKVNATLSWVTGDYGTPYDYSGPRLDMNLNPDGSNWYYDLGFRKQFHDSRQRYQRAEAMVGYRFRFDEGWIQPSFRIREDLTTYDNGNRTTIDFYTAHLTGQRLLSERFTFASSVILGIEREEVNTASNQSVRRADRLTWEIEPGVRFKSSANTMITLNYFNAGKRSDKGDTWGLTDNSRNQQMRFYFNWNTPIGLVITPYVRYALNYGETSGWYESAAYSETKTKSKVNRLALQMAYPLSDSFRLQAEYYIEDVKYKKGYTMGKEDSSSKYMKVGVRATF